MDPQSIGPLFQLLAFFVLLASGFGIGRYLERRHYRSIRSREKELNGLPAVAVKVPDAQTLLATSDARMVMGNVVISVDYFKRFVAGLRNVIGRRIRGYETLLDRARREAVLRMKQEAGQLGANLVFNVKFETASISKGSRRRIGSVEVLAYGTALIPKR